MIKRKKSRLLLLAAVLSLIMAGCGSNDDTKSDAAESEAGGESVYDEAESDYTSEEATDDDTEESGDESGTLLEADNETDSEESTTGESADTKNSESSSSESSSSKSTSSGSNSSGSSSTKSTTSSSSTTKSTTSSSSSTTKSTTSSSSTTKSTTSSTTAATTTAQSTTAATVKVETETTVASSVGSASSQIAEQNEEIVEDNATEYTSTSNNSSTKKIYLSKNSANYGYALAYVNGDTSLLDSTQKQILAVIEPLLDSVMADYDTDAEREKAIHDYIVSNCAYDIEACEDITTINEYDFHPEGVFLKKKAVCQGYAESFKLCMDLLGIQCDIVTGSGNGEAHAWNAVCLDNEWYQIDCTWDDPLVVVNGVTQDSGSIYYNYFNITDTQMKKDHVYTYSHSCTGTKYNYDYFLDLEYGTIYATASDYGDYVNSQLSAGATTITAYVKCNGSVSLYDYLYNSGIDLSNYPTSSTSSGVSMKAEASGVSDSIYTITLTITAY